MERYKGVEREVDLNNFGFVMLKPLGAMETLRSEVLRRLEKVGNIVATKKMNLSLERARDLYWFSGHDEFGKQLSHFEPITRYLTGKDVEIVLMHNPNSTVLLEIDKLVGHYDPEKTVMGEIRHLAVELGLAYKVPVEVNGSSSNNYALDNLVHSSGSIDDLSREIKIFFDDDELSAIFQNFF